MTHFNHFREESRGRGTVEQEDFGLGEILVK